MRSTPHHATTRDILANGLCIHYLRTCFRSKWFYLTSAYDIRNVLILIYFINEVRLASGLLTGC